MKKILLKIRIGSKELLPVLIYDGKSACKASSMKTLSCIVNTTQSKTDIPVVFEYMEDCDGKLKLIHKEVIKLVKQRSAIATIVSRLFCEHSKEQISIEIFFNDTKEGLCIGFLSSKLKPTRYLMDDDYRGSKKVEITTLVSNVLSAKEIFVSNYAAFSDLLMLTQDANNERVTKWEQAIASIPNSSDLQAEFAKYKNNLETWIKLLQSWGLKKDGCKQYSGILVDLNRYNLMNNEQIDEDANYTVISPCWTIWIDVNGTMTEKIVSKGILKQK